MTSELGAAECFVYVTLPGETAFVTAAKFMLTVDRLGVPTGRFVYGRSYLARPGAVPVDPIELKLTAKTYESQLLGGVFGAIRDASPDNWGRRVIQMHSGKPQLGEVDYLLHSPDDRAGALGFGLNATPPAPRTAFNRTLELVRLQALADAVVADEDLPGGVEAQHVQDLLLVGTSMGGARPKAVVEDADGLWIAKFNRLDDTWNNARVEHAMLVLARECGLNSARSRIVTIGQRDTLLVKRFDRDKVEGGYRRARMVSALTLLRAGDRYQDRSNWSYVLLAEELRRVVARPKTDAQELFRRMTFNALISNIDDHPRNHAVIAMGNEWQLAPAYDLTPATPLSIERRDLALACGDFGRHANADNLLTQSARFLVSQDEARRIIDDIESNVKNQWYDIARREGVSEQDCRRLAGSFAYDGFRMPLQGSTRS